MFQGYTEPQWKVDARLARIQAAFPRAYEPIQQPPADELTLEDCIQIAHEVEVEQMARIDALHAQMFGNVEAQP